MSPSSSSAACSILLAHVVHESQPSQSLSMPAAALLSHILGWPTDTQPPSLYTRLLPYHSAPDRDLDPSPPINSALSSLVAALQGEHQAYPTAVNFASVQHEVCDAIDASLSLQSRAAVLRTVASRAESRLELYYVPVLVASSYRPPPRPNATGTSNERIAAAAADFPYIGNYVTMVEREAAVLRGFLARPVRHVVFCGSGPLPLTGLLLAAYLGDVHVTLVDNDEEAVTQSRKLISEWDKRGVIDARRVHVICADCVSLRFGSHTAFKEEEEEEEGKSGDGENDALLLRCDVLFVAALIPQDAKEKLARAAREAGKDGPLVVVRSAHGLTARLAYERSGRERLGRVLEFVATVVPRTHKLPDGRIIDDEMKPVDFFETEILNSLELYRYGDANLHT